MRRDSVVRNSVKISVEDSVQKVLDILEKEDGRSFEEKKAEVISYLKSQESTLMAQRLLSNASNDEKGLSLKAKFWKNGVISASNDIVLRDVEDKDKESFIELQRQYGMFKSMLKEDSYRSMLWEEHIESKTLMCSIIVHNEYAGYCGIKNLSHDKWEIAIEILKDWTNQGVGYIALKAFVEAIKNRLDVSEFRIRIDPGNTASQMLFEKLGAVPNGISEYMLYDEKHLKRCEDENMDLIDNNVIALAEKFGVEPRKLLSHVLEYKLTVE